MPVMKKAKDLFSQQAATYATYRPHYPAALFEFLYSHVRNFNFALDCATGNGQTAIQLTGKFKRVYAIDISTQLLKQAPEKPNLEYKIERAEETSFLDDTFDLITVSTALHWFDHKSFFNEATRVAKNKALFAAWAYAPFRINKQVDAIVDYYYSDIVGPYWDPERKFVDEEYKTIPFPYEEIKTPDFSIITDWTRDQFIGFLHSWSSTQNYINSNGTDPVKKISEQLFATWKDGEKLKVRFPLFMRVGYIHK